MTGSEVQVPSCVQGKVSKGFAACTYRFFAPLKAGCKVRARFTVSRFPEETTLDEAPFSTHWLFCALPLPGVRVLAGCAPASVSSASVFSARL